MAPSLLTISPKHDSRPNAKIRGVVLLALVRTSRTAAGVGVLPSARPLKSELVIPLSQFPCPAFLPLLLGSASGSKPCARRDGGTLLCRFPLKVSPNKASLALGSRTRSLSVAPTEGARKGDTKCSARIASRSSAFSAKTLRPSALTKNDPLVLG